MTELHLFVIPTDRECAANIESYAPEIARLARRRSAHVLILQDRPLPAAVTQRHREALARVLHPGLVDGSVVTYDDWQKLASQEWPSHVMKLVHGDEVNYGRVLNKTAVIAAALGAAVVHRRDSDTSLPLVCQEWEVFPVDYELDALGDGKCDIAGSNYWGDWNVILGDLARDETRLRTLLSAQGIPQVGQDSIINEQLPRSCLAPERNPGALSDGPYPDLGNSAMRTKVLLDFPAPLIEATTGTDYLLLGAAVNLGRAWLHGLRVRHERSRDRATPEYLLAYYVCRARQMDFLLLIRELFRGKRSASSFSEHASALAEAVPSVVAGQAQLTPARMIHWAAYSEAFRGSDIDRSTGLCDVIASRREHIQHQNIAELSQYGALLSNWGELRHRLVRALREVLHLDPEVGID